MKARLLEVSAEVTDLDGADEWSDQLEELLGEVGGLFGRVEVRRRLRPVYGGQG
ncbi:hypothetical protein ACFWIB_43050 [Streptomyces sp. NPDC127051]|uniref:hypothetical protein n=1 Tax=Streptomyces sp. NPDC127051 TaxID=3347119 RepID=UPI003668B9B8